MERKIPLLWRGGRRSLAGWSHPLKNEVWRGGYILKRETTMRDTQKYFSLPYNAALKERAKALRKAGNLAEVLLWQQLKKKQLLGLDFDRQKIIGNYIVDFYCASENLVIEVDGSSHESKEKYDAQRDRFLEGFNLKVIHLSDKDVKTNLDKSN
jgi:very-short-patch-repair endonuclease